MSAWPENCPVCGGMWKVRSKTMGAKFNQPHRGRCVNNHWWHETQSPAPRTLADAEDAVVRDAVDAVRRVFEERGVHFDSVAQGIAEVIRDAWQDQAPTPERTS